MRDVAQVTTVSGQEGRLSDRLPPVRRRQPGEWVIVGLELVVAVNAVVAGVAMLRNPLTPLGTTTALIADSPFSTYTWPGVLLLVLNGAVPALLAVGVIARIRLALALSAAWGVGLVAWIVTQWFLLSDVMFLQYVLVAVGAVVTVLGVRAWRGSAEPDR
jgi:hypothetical protein